MGQTCQNLRVLVLGSAFILFYIKRSKNGFKMRLRGCVVLMYFWGYFWNKKKMKKWFWFSQNTFSSYFDFLENFRFHFFIFSIPSYFGFGEKSDFEIGKNYSRLISTIHQLFHQLFYFVHLSYLATLPYLHFYLRWHSLRF